MPSLYNTVGNLKYYNFISNYYPSGVPIGAVRNFVANAGVHKWMQDYACASTDFAGTDLNGFAFRSIYFIFPKVVSSPTENETVVTQVNTTTNYRFNLHWGAQPDSDRVPFVTAGADVIMKTTDTGVAATNNAGLVNYPQSVWPASLDQDSTFNHFVFATKSPSTLAIANFRTKTNMGLLDSSYSSNDIVLMGWLHDSIYPAPPSIEANRYNSCFALYVYNIGGVLNFIAFSGVLPTGKAAATFITLGARYYDISCTVGSYSAGKFLTDLILSNSVSPFTQIGKVDNRVACLGRGDFIKGKTYQVTDVFGRTGTEYWTCAGSITPSTFTPPTWTPTLGLPVSKYKAWKTNELDYLLLRTYVEGDL